MDASSDSAATLRLVARVARGDERPPLAWFVEAAGAGVDPVAAAWAACEHARPMWEALYAVYGRDLWTLGIDALPACVLRGRFQILMADVLARASKGRAA